MKAASRLDGSAEHAETADVKPAGRSRTVLIVIGVTLATLAGIVAWGELSLRNQQEAVPRQRGTSPLDTRRAYDYLVQICRIGGRVSGSKGMEAQQKLLAEHFAKFEADVKYQSFDVAHPVTGEPVRMSNMLVSWDPQAKERVLVCCHYDTRPFPDRDRFNPRGTFIGANDGGSGVALLMELAHHMQDLKPTYGVDFVFFDGEELVFGPDDKYFLGSEYFAKEYRDNPPEHRYVAGVLLDMVADRNLNLYIEKNSRKYAPDVTASIWRKARELGVREFIQQEKYEINDDHLPLNEIAKIPTCDIIDFDYPYWHTTQDLPSNCSGASLSKVGWVVLKWLEDVPKGETTR